MARKLDLSGVKTFFFAKGEKLGMAACAAAACVLVGYGVMNGMGAKNAPNTSSTFPKAYEANLNNIIAQINQGETVQPLTLAAIPPWLDVVPNFPQGKLFPGTDTANSKRNNPRALPIKADPEKNQIRMDYVRGSIFAYDINHQRKTAVVVKDAAPQKREGFAPAMGKAVIGQHAVVTVQPKRMVVVQAVFPLSDQIEEFRKAFRMMHPAELFASKDLPRFLGMNIMKAEVVPGQPLTWTPLVRNNAALEKDEVDPALMAMLREAIFDDELLTLGAPFAFQGLVMPLPKLAGLPKGQTYPKGELEGLEHAWAFVLGGGALAAPGGQGGIPGMVRAPGLGGALPGMPPAGGIPFGAGAEFDSVQWTKLTPDLQDKFQDRFYAFEPSGILPDPNEGIAPAGDKAAAAMAAQQQAAADENASAFQVPSQFSATAQWMKYPAPPMPKNMMPAPKDGVPGLPIGAGAPKAPQIKPYEALVRFVDVDVKPGKTYKYSVQVRIANPNYKKPTEVAFAGLAELKELPPAPPVETPTITIPTEYFLYAVDQQPLNPKVVNGSESKDVKATTFANPNQMQVPIQIHSWVERTVDDNGTQHVIADWAILERQLLRRGDAIGKTTNIEVAVYDKKLGKYDLGQPVAGNNGGQMPVRKIPGGGGGIQLPPKGLGMPVAPKKDMPAAEPGSTGIPVEFAETTPPAVLIDFDGGKKSYVLPTASGSTIKTPDDSASNLLILNADGKLVVRNSRIDSDTDSADGKLRLQRIEEWKTKTAPYRRGGEGVTPGGGVPDAPNPFLMPRKGGAN